MDDLVRGDRVAIVPARGGSRRLPGKNVIEFNGRPMIAWTIAAALECGLFRRVVVSTDDPGIAEIAVRFGADVPALRDRYADDVTPVSAATLLALDQAETHFGEHYHILVQLMANCPLRGAAHVRAALDEFEAHDSAFQVSCFRFGWMNPWWAMKRDEEGRPVPLFSEALTQRSQDLPPLYCPSGAIWIARTDALRTSGTFHAPDRRLHVMDWRAALDIDDAEDLAMARAVSENKRFLGRETPS